MYKSCHQLLDLFIIIATGLFPLLFFIFLKLYKNKLKKLFYGINQSRVIYTSTNEQSSQRNSKILYCHGRIKTHKQNWKTQLSFFFYI